MSVSQWCCFWEHSTSEMLSLHICGFAQMAVSQDVELNNVSWSGHFFNSAANDFHTEIIVIWSNTLRGSWNLHLRRLLSLWKGNHAIGQKWFYCVLSSINFKNCQILYTVYCFLHIENKIWECTGKVVHCSDRRAPRSFKQTKAACQIAFFFVCLMGRI